MAFLSPAVEMKKDSKLYIYIRNHSIWLKIRSRFREVQTRSDKKKLRKTHFFVMTYFRGRPIAQKFKNTLKSQILNKKCA